MSIDWGRISGSSEKMALLNSRNFLELQKPSGGSTRFAKGKKRRKAVRASAFELHSADVFLLFGFGEEGGEIAEEDGGGDACGGGGEAACEGSEDASFGGGIHCSLGEGVSEPDDGDGCTCTCELDEGAIVAEEG